MASRWPSCPIRRARRCARTRPSSPTCARCSRSRPKPPPPEESRMLRITVAQLNYMVGDVAGNVGKMVDAARQAAAAHADVVVFSELSLTGYYPGDLLDEPDFLARVAQGLADLQVAS